MIVRRERPGDEAAIGALTAAAFAGHPFSDGSEPRIVRRLRETGALSLSLVCEEEGAITGHVALSPVTVPDGAQGWYGLGPISVAPGLQRQGRGSALMRAALEWLREKRASGCVLVGDRGYYGRFGFAHPAGLAFPGAPPEYFLALPLSGEVPGGIVAFHPAFTGKDDAHA